MDDGRKKKKESFLAAVIKPLFGIKTKTLSLLEEEQVQSPGKTIIKEFFRRKLTIVGLVGFFTVFTLCMVLPIFFPVNLREFDTAQFNQPPSRGMMTIPRALRGNIALLDAGPGYGVGVSHNGDVYTWGVMALHSEPLQRPPQPGRPVKHVSAGQSHALVVTEDGHVYVWGDENIVFMLALVPPQIQGRVVTAEAGRRFSIALTDDGRVHTWGNQPDLRHVSPGRLPRDRFGVQLAVNSMSAGVLTDCGRVYMLISEQREFRNVPEEIQGKVVDFALTDGNGAAVLDDGTVVVWGTFGPVNEIPEHIQGRAVSIEGGFNHYTVLLDDGTVESWGDNRHQRATAPNIDDVVYIATGGDHNYAVMENGSVRTWGLRGFYFGTDHMGRCIFTRLWQAGRYSLLVGAVSVLVSGIIGLLLGGTAGYFGGKLDMFIMRFAEAVGSIPFLPLALIIQFRFRDHFSDIGAAVFLMGVLGLLSWPGLMRLIRGQILQARESEYVVAAKALGVRQFKVIFRHILPNVASAAIVWLTLSLAGAMLLESMLSFIGFGITEPTPTWGNMLTGANNSIVLREQWWRWVFPAVALVTVALSINLIGDGLREATDPKAQGR